MRSSLVSMENFYRLLFSSRELEKRLAAAMFVVMGHLPHEAQL
jgi:hypothetical protein